MPYLEITIFNQKLKLSYQENEKQRLIYAVEKLNNNWKKFSALHGKVSDLKIVTLISLELQDSIEDIQALKNTEIHNNNMVETLKKEIKNKNQELKDKLEIIKKYKLELNNNNKQIFKAENILDELHEELIQIKDKLLQNMYE